VKFTLLSSAPLARSLFNGVWLRSVRLSNVVPSLTSSDFGLSLL
jgi:hypothetical protein